MILSQFIYSIPSPARGVWHIGPLPIRAYALCILTGIFVAWYFSAKRYKAKGGDPEVISGVALWLIISGIIGARLYHVATCLEPFFGPGGRPISVFYVWEGGLAIFGGIMAASLTGFLYARYHHFALGPMADSIAPFIILAQAFGRLGNWFNQEVFGQPTTLPWGLQIDNAHLPAGYAPGTLFHPTFLYEIIWNLCMFGLLLWWEKHRKIVPGQLFCGYLMAYSIGRAIIEIVRIDESYYVFGVRINIWTALIVLGVAVVMYRRLGKQAQLPLTEQAQVR